MKLFPEGEGKVSSPKGWWKIGGKRDLLLENYAFRRAQCTTGSSSGGETTSGGERPANSCSGHEEGMNHRKVSTSSERTSEEEKKGCTDKHTAKRFRSSGGISFRRRPTRIRARKPRFFLPRRHAPLHDGEHLLESVS